MQLISEINKIFDDAIVQEGQRGVHSHKASAKGRIRLLEYPRQEQNSAHEAKIDDKSAKLSSNKTQPLVCIKIHAL